MSKEKEEKRQRLVLALLAFVMFALNCIRIGNLSVGGDEAYSMLLARKFLAGIITETAMDVHPPLYYFILKAATLLFHENIRMLRLVSLLPVGILVQNALGRMKWGAAAIVILWMLGGAAGFFRLYETEKGYTRQTAETMEYMEQNLQEKDMVVSDIVDLSWTILEFHFPDNKKELTDLKPQGEDAAAMQKAKS